MSAMDTSLDHHGEVSIAQEDRPTHLDTPLEYDSTLIFHSWDASHSISTANEAEMGHTSSFYHSGHGTSSRHMTQGGNGAQGHEVLFHVLLVSHFLKLMSHSRTRPMLGRTTIPPVDPHVARQWLTGPHLATPCPVLGCCADPRAGTTIRVLPHTRVTPPTHVALRKALGAPTAYVRFICSRMLTLVHM